MLFVALAACVLGLPGCDSSPKPRPKVVSPVVRDTPPVLRGTIGSESTFIGIEPTLVSGLGLVVGLNGTGGGPLPDRIAVTMEREMGLRGIGRAGDYEGTPIANVSPREMLRDKNVAVVIVQAAIPPGSPKGATFDVYVRAVNATSLEGGKLWSTDLRIGPAALFGAVTAQRLAVARGPVFINPFAEPGKLDDGVTRTVGRVLEGGQVTEPFEIAVVTDAPGFARARAITSAINTRFPEEPGGDGPIARGLTGGSLTTGDGGRIAIRVPSFARERPDEFINTIRWLQIDQQYPEEYARRYIDGLKAEPQLAEQLCYALQGLGQRAIPFIRELYDFPERIPRFAALRAGAILGDAQAAGALTRIARQGSVSERTEAIGLLARLDAGPTVDSELRQFLDSPDLLVRIAAYDGLASRAERFTLRQLIAQEQDRVRRASPPASMTQLELLSQVSLVPNIQGISRRLVPGKFILDIVPVGEPLIYIAQQGRPRIVLFGADPSLRRPLLVSAWSDRLLLLSDDAQDPVRVRYRDWRTERVTQSPVDERLPAFVDFAAHNPTPEDPIPGLSMTYSEVVGALYAIHQAGGTNAAFATERDRLLAQLTAASTNKESKDRPETTGDQERVVIFNEPEKNPMGNIAPPATPKVVPIEPKDPKKKPKK
jgi:hypothetical protein